MPERSTRKHAHMTTAGLPAISNGASYEMRDIVAARAEKRWKSERVLATPINVYKQRRDKRSIPKSRFAGRDFSSDKTVDTLTITRGSPRLEHARARSVN